MYTDWKYHEDDKKIQKWSKAWNKETWDSVILNIFKLIQIRSYDGLKEQLSEDLIDTAVILKLPEMRDSNDGNKTLIQKCCNVKSSLICEMIIELYRKVYIREKTTFKEKETKR